MRFVAQIAPCLVALAALGMVGGNAGCGASPAEVARLRDEGDDGPRRLAAIVRHASGTVAVQKDAVLALVTLTRRGRHVGLDLLGPALGDRSAESRAALLDLVSAELVEGMTLSRTATDDPALVYKDGAYLLYARGLLTADSKDALGTALTSWARESPMERLDDARQRYGAPALLHALGPAAARLLSRHFDDDRSFERALGFVLAEGDDETKRSASISLSRLVTAVRTPAWRESKRPELEAANKASRVKTDPLLVDMQLRKVQSNALGQIFRALARLANPEGVLALLGAAGDHDLATSDRVAAVQGLAACAASLDDPQLDGVIAIATVSAVLTARSEDAARAEAAGGQAHYDAELAKAALSCAARAPRARAKLLALVATTRSWRLRMEIASALLRDAKPSALDEILARLPAGPDLPMSRAEITAYGAALEPVPETRAAAQAHLGDVSLGARLTALATMRRDRAALAAHEKDKAPLPRCATADECDWTCRGAPVTTVGEYVHMCLQDRR